MLREGLEYFQAPGQAEKDLPRNYILLFIRDFLGSKYMLDNILLIVLILLIVGIYPNKGGRNR